MKKEYIIDRTSSVTLNVTAGKIDSFRKQEETTSTVRVYRDGKIGIAGVLGDGDEAALTEKAEAALSLGIPYVEALDGAMVRAEHCDAEILPEKELVPVMQALLDRVSAACPRFAISNKIMLSHDSREYRNSEGRSLSWSDRVLSIGLVFQDRGAGNLMDGFYEYTGRTFAPDAVVEECRKFHDAFYTPAVLEQAGEMPVVFTPYELFGTFLRNFVGEFYASGASLISGKLGETCFSDRLTFEIDRNPETSYDCPFFDAEGQVAEDLRVPLIRNGVLENLLATKQTAAQYGLRAAGTAGAVYDGVPGVSIPSIRVKPTAASLAELVPGKSVLVVTASGGDTTPQGHFATPVQCAFLMEDGKPVGRLPELSVSGDFFDLLGKNWIGAVAGDPQPNSLYCAVRMKVEKQ